MIARVIVCIAILATSGYGQIPKDRLMAFFDHQSTRVYYWGIALDKPPDSYQKDRQFVPVKLQRAGESSKDSIMLLTTGLQAGDSVFFYFVPTVNESGATLTRATGDTIKYRETSAPPATTSDLARETRSTLDSLSVVLPNYNFLSVKEKHFHGSTENFLAAGSCVAASALFVQYKGGLNDAVAILSGMAGAYMGYKGLRRAQQQSERLKSIEQLQKLFPPGF